MDPNETLAEIRELLGQDREQLDGLHRDDVATLMERFEALDAWLSKGGFSPWDNNYGKLKSFSGRFNFNGIEYRVVEIEFEGGDKFEEYDTLTIYAREQD